MSASISGHVWVGRTTLAWGNRVVIEERCARCEQWRSTAEFNCPATKLLLPATAPSPDARALPIAGEEPK